MQRSRRGFLAIAALAIAVASVPPARGMDRADDLQASGFGPRASDRPRLTLTFVDFTELPEDISAALQAEVTDLVATLGVAADIQTMPPGSLLDTDAITLIVLPGVAPANLTRGVMGAVQREGASRVLWIYASSVAAGTRLGWGDRRRWSVQQREDFATALARVAVHEVVHLVCPWRDHDDQGLMAGMLTHASLTGSRIPFSRELRREFTLGVDSMAGAAFSVARGGPAPRH